MSPELTPLKDQQEDYSDGVLWTRDEGPNHMLIQGNSLNLVSSGVILPSSVSLVVTSPPYPGVKQPEEDYVTFYDPKAFNDCHDFLEKMWRMCYAALEDLGRLSINIMDVATGADGVYPNAAATIKRCLDIGFVLREEFIWAKGASYSPPHGSWPYPKGVLSGRTWESILVFQKPLQFGQRRIDPSSYPDHVREASKLGPKHHALLMDTVWHISPEKTRNHPFPFPAEIAENLIEMYTFVGDKVLDPFSGSGTTMLAAKRLDRLGIGCELSDRYVEITRQLLDQGSLF